MPAPRAGLAPRAAARARLLRRPRRLPGGPLPGRGHRPGPRPARPLRRALADGPPRAARRTPAEAACCRSTGWSRAWARGGCAGCCEAAPSRGLPDAAGMAAGRPPATGRWPSWNEAIGRSIGRHGRRSRAPLRRAAQRLAFDELLASQLALALMRAARTRLPGRALAGDGTWRSGSRQPALPADRLPERAIAEIQRRPRRALAHAAPAAGRCRQRQDRGGAGRDAAGGRGRGPGGADGADRGAGAAARGDACAACWRRSASGSSC